MPRRLPGLVAAFFHKPTRAELIRKGDIPALTKLLRKHGVDKALNDPLDNEGNTPLILAAGRGSYRLVNWLVTQEGIQLDGRNRFGWTALYEAAGTGHRHVLERLVQAGADPTIPASAWPRHTPSQMAKQMGWSACVEVLQRAERDWKEKQQQQQQEKESAVLPPTSSSSSASEEKEETKEESRLPSSSISSSSTLLPTKPSSPSPTHKLGALGESLDSTVNTSISSSISSSSTSSPPPPPPPSSTPLPPPPPSLPPTPKVELPACLRWQVEEGVGEGGGEGRVGGWWAEAEEDWLEVHPAVFSKRGPRVGRHRQAQAGGGWLSGWMRRNKTLTNLATGRTSGRIRAKIPGNNAPRWVVQKV